MRRVFTAVTGLVLAAVIAGCGGSGSPTVSETSGSPSSSPTVLPSHGGLVGIIDSARKVAVCANVELYTTTVEGGLQHSADQAFAATIQTLEQGPRETGLNALVRRWQRWHAKLGDAETARRLTAFCASQAP